MPSTKIQRNKNCIHITVIYFQLELLSKSVSLEILGLKLVKVDCTVI